MEMPLFAFEIDAARLLDHAVVVRNLHIAADLAQRRAKYRWLYRLGSELLPAAAMNEYRIAEIQMFPRRLQSLVEVLPNHEGEAKEQDALPCVFP